MEKENVSTTIFVYPGKVHDVFGYSHPSIIPRSQMVEEICLDRYHGGKFDEGAVGANLFINLIF